MNSLPPENRITRIARWRREHRIGQLAEAFYPLAFSAVTLVVVLNIDLDEAQVSNLVSDVLPTAVTVGTVLAGFQATAQSVLIALIDSPAWNYLQRARHDHTLVKFHWATIRSLLAFIVLSLLTLIADAVGWEIEKFKQIVPAVLGAVLVYAGCCSYRIADLMVMLLRQKDKAPVVDDERTQAQS